MKISIKQYQNKDRVQVHKMTAQQLCESKLALINERIRSINNEMRVI